MTAALLAAVAVIVGFFTGAVGPGGVLLIPAFVILGGLDIHQATATALFIFLFTGILGTWLFHRKGHVHWKVTLPVCLGSVVFSYLGAMVNATVESRPLTHHHRGGDRLLRRLPSAAVAPRPGKLPRRPRRRRSMRCCWASARCRASAPACRARAGRCSRCH